MPEILQNVNWLDVLFVILLLGMVYRGTRSGVSSQLISLVLYLALLYGSLGAYGYVSDKVFSFLMEGWKRFAAFLVVGSFLFVAIKMVEKAFNVTDGKDMSKIEKTGGALIATMRGAIICGLVGIGALMIPIEYVQTSAKDESKICMHLVNFDVNVYSWMRDAIMSKKQKAEKEVLPKDEIMNRIVKG